MNWVISKAHTKAIRQGMTHYLIVGNSKVKVFRVSKRGIQWAVLTYDDIKWHMSSWTFINVLPKYAMEV